MFLVSHGIDMLPDPESTGFVSSMVVRGNFLLPLRNNLLYDYEWGGIGLNDPSAGLNYRKWKLFYNKETGDLFLKRADQDTTHLVLNQIGITNVGLSFDFNMNPQVVYVYNNKTYFYWYDTAASGYITTEIVGAKNPCISLDDNRDVAADTNDIILAYQKDTGLYFRRQRDRYQTEYLIYSDIPENVRLHQIGLTDKFRMQFYFKLE